jgi:hypothetical protein
MSEQERTKSFEIKDNIYVEGISEDYVWYESKLLLNSMKNWQFKFEKIVSVMENRHKEHLAMIDDLL